jgi:hypothetical protein
MPNFELWHSCRKWAICFRIFWAFFKQGIITDTLCKNFRSTVYIDALNLYLRVWEFKSPLRLNVPQEAGSGRPLCTRHKIQDTSYVLQDYQMAKPPPPPPFRGTSKFYDYHQTHFYIKTDTPNNIHCNKTTANFAKTSEDRRRSELPHL